MKELIQFIIIQLGWFIKPDPTPKPVQINKPSKPLPIIKDYLNPKTNNIETHIFFQGFPNYTCVIRRLTPPTAAHYALFLVFIDNSIKKIGTYIYEQKAIDDAILTLQKYIDTAILP